MRDALSFLKLITRLGMYFAPWRALMPVAAVTFVAFLSSFAYDILVIRNLGDKSVLLLMPAVNIFFFALIADMVNRRLG